MTDDLQLLAAMSVASEVYHEAMGLGLGEIICNRDAKTILSCFDPQTGEFDCGGLQAHPGVLKEFLPAQSEIYGPIGSFRIRKMIARIRAQYQKAQMEDITAIDYDDPEAQLSAMSSKVLQLGQLAHSDANNEEEIQVALAEIDAKAAGKPQNNHITWPLRWMEPLGSIGKQEFIVVGGRPGSGKSAIMGQVAYELAQTGRNVMFITLEMAKNELRHRFTAYKLGYSMRRVEPLHPDKCAAYRRTFEQISRNPHLILAEHYSIAAILSAISRQAIRGLDLVCVDYLQLVTGQRGTSRLEQLSDITRQLKLTAKELRVPVMVGSQLNRASEQQERPSLSSLRESGSIEQDADRVLLLHDNDGIHELIQAKYRQGQRMMIQTKFTGETTSFAPLTAM